MLLVRCDIDLSMGYIIRRLNQKNRAWKVQYRTHVGGDHVRDISENDYLRLGLNRRMGIEEVQGRLKQLNAQEKLKRLEEKRLSIKARMDLQALQSNSFLPDNLRDEFETNHIDATAKKASHWRTAKLLLAEMQIDPIDWEFNKAKWYRLFQSKNYSGDYIQKLLLVLNKWGRFCAYRQKTYFEQLSTPRGRDKQRLVDSYENNSTSTKESNPLTPKLLESIRSRISLAAYNWLWLSLYLGLRPMEVDSLLKPPGDRSWRLEMNYDGGDLPVLWVYQGKLTGLSSKERLKPIILKYDEQRACIAIIQSKQFKRPLNKTLKLHTGGQVTTYGGRKNFVDMMLAKGNSLEAISQWLGHRSINRTWASYKNKKVVLTD